MMILLLSYYRVELLFSYSQPIINSLLLLLLLLLRWQWQWVIGWSGGWGCGGGVLLPFGGTELMSLSVNVAGSREGEKRYGGETEEIRKIWRETAIRA
jgi:hypothetical protein